MAGFILRGLIAALGLWAATEMLDGFTIEDTPAPGPAWQSSVASSAMGLERVREGHRLGSRRRPWVAGIGSSEKHATSDSRHQAGHPSHWTRLTALIYFLCLSDGPVPSHPFQVGLSWGTRGPSTQSSCTAA